MGSKKSWFGLKLDPLAEEIDFVDEKLDPKAPPSLVAIRMKAKMFVEFLENECETPGPPSRVLVEDYNRLRELAVEAAPHIATIIPPPIADHQLATEAEPRTVTYSELHFFCKQIARFL